MVVRYRLDGRVHRFAEGSDRVGDHLELRRRETSEYGSEQGVTQGIDLVEHLRTVRGHPDEDDPPVRRDALPRDVPAFLQPVDQAGGIGERHVEHFGEVAHGHLAASLQGEHDVELRHAHAEPQQPFARQAFELAHRGPEIGDDGARRVRSFDRRWLRDGCDSSYHTNYLSHANYSVNIND